MCLTLIAVCVLYPCVSAAQTIAPKTILVLHTYGSQSPFRPVFDRVLQATLNRNGFEDAEVYVETLESNRFPGGKHAALFQYYLGQKYAGRKIDVLITVWDRALSYALEHRAQLFPDAPIVSLVTQPRTVQADLPIALVTAGDHFFDTAKLALTLHPNARRIVVVDGSLQSDDVQTEITRQLRPLASRAALEYLRDLPLATLVERVKGLPDDAVILFIRQSMRTPSQAITGREALEQIAGAARVPIYVAAESIVGQGVVGGVVFKNEGMAELAAETAIRILNGTPAREASLHESRTQPTFDWRQLHRWKIAIDQLPLGSDVRFREYTFWEQNSRYVVPALALFLVQGGLIVGLLVQGARRRRTERALRANEQALRVSHEDSRRLAGHIIAAQEVERARIARDLHDDLSQKVALLAMDIHEVSLAPPDAAPGTLERVNAMVARAAEIATDVHNLSHELHPAKLHLLGLVPATQYFCRDFASRHDLQIDFSRELVPQDIAPDLALCLFRIVQEALRNVVKHSGARKAAVRLSGSPGWLRLDISDQGNGFDASELRGGIGLLSMRERANFLDGDVTIESKPGSGTRIAVRMPLKVSSATADRAAARIA